LGEALKNVLGESHNLKENFNVSGEIPPHIPFVGTDYLDAAIYQNVLITERYGS